jgi:hypothetical protein
MLDALCLQHGVTADAVTGGLKDFDDGVAELQQ